ncbi:MAG: ABC transporter ATP-binding protein [Tissierellia bacterium]|nr:ABC transporter ATP-binding protein [Tissierellia bacterium]
MIRLKDVTAGYNGFEIIKDIDLSFEKGSITSIIGKNGCGKTTLLKVASNLLKPYRGDVILNGVRISDLDRNKIAKQISFLPQVRSIPNITVSSLVMHGRFPYLGFSRIPSKEDRAKVEEAMRKMGITKYKDKNLRELSGGERQKVYIAMVLAQDTDVIFLDEPTTYLDINHQLEILRIVKELKDMGKTIVMVLHDLTSGLTYSDRICLMEKGRIVIYDTPQAVFESKEIDRVFDISSEQVYIKSKEEIQYVFSLSS